MNKNHKWEDETDRLRNSFFTEGFHCLVYNVSEAYNLVKAHKHDFPQFVIIAVRRNAANAKQPGISPGQRGHIVHPAGSDAQHVPCGAEILL